MLYRNVAKESRDSGVVVRELLIRSMVAGDSNRDRAPAGWISDEQVGRAVCDLVVGQHEREADPIVELLPPGT